MRKLSLVLIVLGFIGVVALFALVPGLDLYVTTHYFFDTEKQSFVYAAHPVIVSLRNLNSAVDIMFGVVLGVAVIHALLAPHKTPLVTRNTVLFLGLTFAMAPGVVSNLVFKENWGRPRPYHVVEYGGASIHREWWDPRGSCTRSCSFFSGEVSAAAWTMAPAVLVPGPMRAVAIAASMAFTVAIAVVRIAQGGHFLSDAAFGALATWLIVWIGYGMAYRRRSDASAVFVRTSA